MFDQRREREYYRIQYPVRERPRFLVDGKEYEVLNCSEMGVCYVVPGEVPIVPGDVVHGKIRFSRGDEVEIEGVVVRVQDGTVALHLAAMPIPFVVILNEQQYLRQKYPMWPREV
ncbi:MAG: PilZ domain-containing protein [bacterium]|jgi:hypothetical protein|nr:MAG: hypothetical protein DIU52_05510 [bacterium]